MYYLIVTILIGAFSGFSSGMFGISGSNFATPLLRVLIELTPIFALATPIVSGIPSAISGSYLYGKERLIDFEAAWLVLITAIPFSIIGSYTTRMINSEYLVIAKAILLLLLGIKFIASGMSEQKVCIEKKSVICGLVSGVVGGFVAGILAIGGGPIFITAFAKVNRMPMKKAVATSLFCVGIISLINSLAQLKLGHVHLPTALILTITVIPFSYLGARASVRLKNKVLEKAFGAAMVVFAIYFIISQYS